MYKCLDYIVVWILVYFAVKCSGLINPVNAIEPVDCALIASAIVLGLCVLDNLWAMWYGQPNGRPNSKPYRPEHMDGSIQPNTHGTAYVPPDTVRTDAMRGIDELNGFADTDLRFADVKPNAPQPQASQPLVYDKTISNALTPDQPNPLYQVTDYLGNHVVLDENGFGGTNGLDSYPTNGLDSYPTNPSKPANLSKPIMCSKPMRTIRPDDVLENPVKPLVPKPLVPKPLPSDPLVSNPLPERGKPLKWYEQAFNPRDYAGAENLDQIAVSGGKTRNDLLVNEMIYSDFNRLPPSFIDKDFEYGYSFLPPKDWYPLPVYPPVCATNKSCLVQPVYVDSSTMDLKEWHQTQRPPAPESINTTFITNELNRGDE